MREVLVAAMETISPLGASLQDHMEGIGAGTSGSAPLCRFDARSFPTTFGCEVKQPLTSLYGKIHPDVVATFPFNRTMELFCCCLHLLEEKIRALADIVASHRIGIFVGADTETLSPERISGLFTVSQQECLELFATRNRAIASINPLVNPSHVATLYAASLAGSTGIRHTNLSACASSAHALGLAYRAIRSDACDCAVVGGVDSTINPFVYAAFSSLAMISTRNESPATASRPFDLTRDGFVPGEGAGVVLLVSESVASQFPKLLARLAGYGSSLDAYKVTAPHEEGLGARLCMERCLACASWDASTVDYINAHGTSTPLNDLVETRALHQVFGEALKSIAVSSTKSQIGHLIAAGGIVEFITVVGAMNEGILPPSINISRPDPACPLSLVSQAGVRRTIRRALSNSFALAGQNATLAIEAI